LYPIANSPRRAYFPDLILYRSYFIFCHEKIISAQISGAQSKIFNVILNAK